MRPVAYVFPQAELGGAEIATARILEAHDRARYTPVAVLFTDGPLAQRLRSAGIDVQVAPARPRLRQLPERRKSRVWMQSFLRTHGISLQHSVMAWTHALTAPAAHAAGVPAVWYQHNRAQLGSLIDWAAALSHTSLIIANSRFTARLQQRLNVLRRRIVVVYPPSVEPQPEYDIQRARHEIGVLPDDIVALLPARLQRWKGQDLAIRALAVASRQVPRLQLVLAGGALFGLEPGYRNDLERLAAKLDLTDRVHFTGFRNDLGALYAASDMVLHTSREPEPYGLSVAEARKHGRAIIASDAGAVPEQVTHEETGLLVPPGDPAALARAMVRLAMARELRTRLATTARAMPLVTPRTAARQLEHLYDQVLDS